MPNEAEYKELRGKIEEKKFIKSSYRKKKEVESMAGEKVVNQVGKRVYLDLEVTILRILAVLALVIGIYLEEGEKLK